MRRWFGMEVGDQARQQTLSLVIPAFNEADGIRQAIGEAADALGRFCASYEIIVVDDGSSDGTADLVAEEARSRPCVRLLRHARNRGYGPALRTGFAAARFSLVAFTDADCQFDLADLASLVALTEHYPVVAGYRADRQDGRRRRLYSWGYNVLTRTLLGTGVRDCDCALKVFRRDALLRLAPQTGGFFVNTEMLTRARQLGLAVGEVAVRHRPRLGGHSKVSLRDIPRTLATLVPFWWSQMLFPRALGDSAGSRDSSAWRWQLPTLLLVAVLLFFARLSCPLLEPEETRYAEIPRQMLVEGRLVEPVWHGEPYYHKPPLLYWLVMCSYGLFGVHDWAARLVPASSALGIVLITFFWGRRVAGSWAGFLGALILCLSVRFVYLGRMLSLDNLLALWVVAALAAGHMAVSHHRLRRGLWILSAVACGLGVLTKGPVALVLVLVPILLIQILDGRTSRPSWRRYALYLGTLLLVAAPWYLAALVRDPHALIAFFWQHNLLRFVAPLDHPEPFWFFLPSLLIGMLPWSLLLAPLAPYLLRRAEPATLERPAALGFFLLAFLWPLLFFSMSGCKRAGYILPALPSLALLLGCYLSRVVTWQALGRAGALSERLTAPRDRLAYGCLLVAVFLGLSASVAALVTGVWPPLLSGSVIAFLGLLLLVIGRFGSGRRAAHQWGLCAAMMFVLLLGGVHQILPGYHRKFALRGVVRAQIELAADAQTPIYCYPRRWDSISFYLGRSDIRVFTPERRGALLAELRMHRQVLLFVKSSGHLKDLLTELPPTLEFIPNGRQTANVTAGIVRAREPGER